MQVAVRDCDRGSSTYVDHVGVQKIVQLMNCEVLFGVCDVGVLWLHYNANISDCIMMRSINIHGIFLPQQEFELLLPNPPRTLHS